MAVPVVAVGRMVAARALRSARAAGVQATGERPSLVLYMVLGVFALLKDLFDIVFGLFPVPGVGIIVSFVLGICFSIILFLLLAIFDRSGGKLGKARMLVRRAGALLAATMVGTVPFISFLPETTLSVSLLYVIAFAEWKKGSSRPSHATPAYA